MKAADIACVVLASGQSVRYGVKDKLEADLGGRTLLETVFSTVESVGFGQIFVVSQNRIGENYRWIENIDPDKGQGHSLRLGLRAARADGWENVIIALGDMPLVRSVNFVNLISKTSHKQVVISECETVRMPPAYFGKLAIDQILEVESPMGARHIFETLKPLTVQIDRESCLDVDTPADLDMVRKIWKRRQQ